MDDAHERISAEDLAKYDVVLTTYPILSKEVNYTTHYDRPRRYERQYEPRKSPFIMIDWWRVCLDEVCKTIFWSTYSEKRWSIQIFKRCCYSRRK